MVYSESPRKGLFRHVWVMGGWVPSKKSYGGLKFVRFGIFSDFRPDPRYFAILQVHVDAKISSNRSVAPSSEEIGRGYVWYFQKALKKGFLDMYGS